MHQPIANAEILIVEDEAVIALDLQRRLNQLGYRAAHVASKGEQALALVEEHRPDLVLMDVYLDGEMKGTDAAKAIQERFSIPVVYLTAYSDPQTLDHVKSAGHDGFLIKPWRIEDIDATIQLALHQHRRQQMQHANEVVARQSIGQLSKDQLDQFTYAAGHDLKEPLRTARSFITLLARSSSPKLDPRERELLSEAQSALSRMTTLLQDLLDYARFGNGDGEPASSVHAEEPLRWAIQNLSDSIDSSDAVITHNPLPTVRADSSQLGRVFQNLISNSIKYRCSTMPPQIHVAVENRENEHLFIVTDNGIGFDPAQSERIFEPFKRLHSYYTYAGTGLGLSICRKIIDSHGGKIWAKSAPGLGAIFFFTLPKG